MNNYDLTIINPAYNCEKFIEQCITSIIKQKNNLIEIIVINDGSTDKTLEKCEELAQKYENIKIINQKNGGVSYSRNVGIQNANGKYIMFVDADDYLEENALEEITDNVDILRYSYIQKSKNNKKEIVFDKEKFDLESNKKDFFYNFFQKTNQNVIWGQAIKKDLLNDIKFNENIFYGEDLLFNYKLYNKCKCIKYTNTILYNYKQNPDSVTRNYKNAKVKSKIENLIYVFNEIILDYKDNDLIKVIENKFIGEIVPQIMMLTFDKEINKKEVLKQFEEILNNKIFQNVFRDINEKELTMCKYNKAYYFMKNKETKKLYMYSKIYKQLKMIQQFIKNT